MFIEKFGKTFAELVASLKESRSSVREVNTIVKNVDPFIMKFGYVRAVWRSLSTLSSFAIFGFLLNRISAGMINPEKITFGTAAAGIGIIVGFMSLSYIIQSFISLKEDIFRLKLSDALDSTVMRKLLALDIARVLDPEFAELKENAERRGVSSVSNLFSSQFQLIGSCVGVVASIAVLGVLNPVLIFLSIIPIIPKTIRSAVDQKRRRAQWEQDHLIRRKKGEYERCITSKNKLIHFKLFCSDSYMHTCWEEMRNTLFAHKKKNEFDDFRMSFAESIVETVVACAVFSFFAFQISKGSSDLGQAVVFFGAVKTLGGSLGGTSRTIVDMRENCQDFEYLTKFLSIRPVIDESAIARGRRLASTPTLEMRDVWFAYPGRPGSYALSGCSLKIAPGEKVAIVGPNGSGKTTTLRLLSKVYLPEKGVVLLENTATSDYRQRDIAQQMVYVTQAIDVPDLPISQAMTGEPEVLRDRVRLQQACLNAGVDSFTENLPDGLETQIGEDWPGGVGFSSGQLQRLKLGSAFYRVLAPDVKVALLDEPMSHCDVETREQFYRTLMTLPKTVVVVAHDPMFLNYFERVIVIENGVVTEDMKGDEIENYRNELLSSVADGE
ncbi:MAG: ABC transporter ATP-binding protein [Candidatus Paceibacterota bacterium]|jgi:ABC-type bacteriocin/lantibiotic exporter with double-glycine peptidase domain